MLVAASGCSNETPPQQTPAATEPAASAATARPETPAQPGASDAPIDSKRNTPEELPLDLSREALSEIENEGADELEEPPAVLPDMFEAQTGDKKTRLSGKVLMNEEATNRHDMVDGIQIEVEVPTN